MGAPFEIHRVAVIAAQTFPKTGLFMAKGYKGKKRDSTKFVKLDHSFLDAQSRAGLSIGARSLIVELMRRYTGTNNGKIYLPTREAAERLGIHRTTVSRFYSELKDTGFIVETKTYCLGLDGKGQASKWRMTHLPCYGKPPTRDYENKTPVRKCDHPCRKL